MNKAMLCAIACLCICPLGFALEPPQKAPDETVKAIKERQPRLAELCDKTIKQLNAVESETRNQVPDEGARRRLIELYKTPRPAEEAGYIIDCLLNAYAQDPPDWLSVRAALLAAQQGVPDPRVAAVARKLVASVRELPDEALTALGPAIVTLVLSGKEQDIELVISCTYSEFVGIQAEADGAEQSNQLRDLVCQSALVALYAHAPLDLAIPALRKVIEGHKNGSEDNSFDMSMSSNAQRYLDWLERVRKGEKVVLPYVE